MADKLLLTPEEAAEALSIGRSKLYELISRGLLETVSIGSCRRIPRSALDEFIARLRASAAPRPRGVLSDEPTRLVATGEEDSWRSARSAR
jgi:excisionase family DNA binding protein